MLLPFSTTYSTTETTWTMFCKLLVLIFLVNVNCDMYDDLFRALFRPLRTPSDLPWPKSFPKSPRTLPKRFDYHTEVHKVVTEDGFKLTLLRFSRNVLVPEKPYPVVIHSGLGASSNVWLFQGPQVDLPYKLVDLGYDVWLDNSRTTVYSREHVTLNADTDRDFWNSSIHELSVYDMSATTDYIIKYTAKPQILYLGHSLGATKLFIWLSIKPKYNKYIRLALVGASTAYFKNHPYGKAVASLLPLAADWLKHHNIYELFPQTDEKRMLFKILGTMGDIVGQIIFFLGGNTFFGQPSNLNTTVFLQVLYYYPASMGLRLIQHYTQFIESNRFRPYVWDREMNLKLYNAEFPPDYDMTKVTAPIALIYGETDQIAIKEDTYYLASLLPNVVGVYEAIGLNHLDFLTSPNAGRAFYQRILDLFEKYS